MTRQLDAGERRVSANGLTAVGLNPEDGSGYVEHRRTSVKVPAGVAIAIADLLGDKLATVPPDRDLETATMMAVRGSGYFLRHDGRGGVRFDCGGNWDEIRDYLADALRAARADGHAAGVAEFREKAAAELQRLSMDTGDGRRHTLMAEASKYVAELK